MTIDKLYKRSVIRVQYPDHLRERAIRSVTDAVGQAMLQVGVLLGEADLQPGDEFTMDIRILVERNEAH